MCVKTWNHIDVFYEAIEQHEFLKKCSDRNSIKKTIAQGQI